MLAEKAALLGQEAELDGAEENNSHSTQPTDFVSKRGSSVEPLTAPNESTSDPLTTASEPTVPTEPSPYKSEKARGKMRASDQGVSQTSAEKLPEEDVMRLAQAGVGPNGYIPTQEWVASWQKG